MTSVDAPLPFDEELRIKLIRDSRHIINNNKYPRHVLKTSCIFKHKCEKILKQKFCKYKLRKNGEEDSDVIDISHVLLSSLKIKSPNKLLKSPADYIDYNSEILRPRNYLFEMARRKLKVKNASSAESPGNDSNSALSITESQERKQTNAFKLLMDSRNKCLGSNSPGKEKNVNPIELQEIMEKKNTRVKRNLALQKMAEAKGASLKKEIEVHQETYVNQKMEERAERLKDMLVNSKQTIAKKAKESKIASQKKFDNKVENLVNNMNDNKGIKETKPLQLIDIFKDVIKPINNVNPDNKIIPKEDEDFLKKLSPSIKKKENMLSYFKKIEKTSITSPEIENAVDKNDTVIKNQMTHKKRKKTKKKILSLSKNLSPDILKRSLNENNCLKDYTELPTQVSEHHTEEICYERKKLKRKENSVEVDLVKAETTIVTTESLNTDERRSKRCIKRPVKYIDDVQLSSSDDELLIFTPKKRKHGENKTKRLIKEEHKIIISDDEVKKKTSSKAKKSADQQKDIHLKKKPKLAPIFASKPQLNSEQIEAKQKFLYSGVPDQIKKIIENQKNLYTEVNNDFPIVVHVQQKVETTNDVFGEIQPLLEECNSKQEPFMENVTDFYKKLITLKRLDVSFNFPSLESNTTTILQTMKKHYPKFPVYRTFRLLKDKSTGVLKECNTLELDNSIEVIENNKGVSYENPFDLNWTDKYKATSTNQIIGNFESLKELKRWLLIWIENEGRPKNTPTNESDSSDFYDSDSNSKDSIKSINNLLILNGPVGSGKTSSVYAVASELAIKVIEVNASSKRTGKMMLQDLQEATQSHKVNRVGLESSQKSQETVDPIFNVKKKRGRPKKGKVCYVKKSNSRNEMSSQSSISQESGRTGMSLILVDDADIVFEQDDGFASAISQLAHISKRPVILVTGSLSCPHLQRFVQCGKVINMNPLSPRMLGTWLDIMCLADTGTCWQGLGAKFLDFFKGDIRKSINCLQFYMTAYTQNILQGDEATSQNSDSKLSPDDENSNILWADNECTEAKNMIQSSFDIKDGIWKYFMNKQFNLVYLSYPKDLLKLWWSVPNLLSVAFEDTENNKHNNMVAKKSKTQNLQELEAITSMIDSISLSDYYSSSNLDAGWNITSQPWHLSENDSVSEKENDDFYRKSDDVTNEIIQELLTGSIIATQNTLQCERSAAINCPSMAVQREKNRITSRHDSLTNIFTPVATLDRKALALDYWSMCRTICRMEKNKTDTVSKRNNRFCHYLKSLNTLGGSRMFDSLADSLQIKGKNE